MRPRTAQNTRGPPLHGTPDQASGSDPAPWAALDEEEESVGEEDAAWSER